MTRVEAGAARDVGAQLVDLRSRRQRREPQHGHGISFGRGGFGGGASGLSGLDEIAGRQGIVKLERSGRGLSGELEVEDTTRPGVGAAA